MKFKKLLPAKGLYFRTAGAASLFFEKGDRFKPCVSFVYFGEEFCEHLTPSLRSVEYVARQAVEHGFEFYLLTGVVAPLMIERYEALFKVLSLIKAKINIVFNDWGILHLLNKRFPKLQPVMGRLLFKNKRHLDIQMIPDGGGFSLKAGVRAEQIRVSRETNLTVPLYKKFLADHGVRKIDVDILPYGLDWPQFSGMDVGVYWPWGYLTSSRTCYMWKGGRHLIPTSPCTAHPCMCSEQVIAANKDLSTELYVKGNVVFYKAGPVEKTRCQRVIYEVDIHSGNNIEVFESLSGG